jgi:hypothetical protein
VDAHPVTAGALGPVQCLVGRVDDCIGRVETVPGVHRADRDAQIERRPGRLLGDDVLAESKGTALGIPADRPSVSGVHDATAKRPYALECLREIVHWEVRKREGITGATSALMNTKPEVS